jgi:hypothetical protein
VVSGLFSAMEEGPVFTLPAGCAYATSFCRISQPRESLSVVGNFFSASGLRFEAGLQEQVHSVHGGVA